jgi:uncharacterized protein involved in outer membrane biogenesis
VNAAETKTRPQGSMFSIADWFNYRRKRFWLVLLFLLYTLSGFFLVPVLLNKVVVDTVREDLGREASFENIHFNPFLLALKVHGFVLTDTDGEVLAEFDRLFVDFQASSLFRWAWTFREISLDGFDILFERFELEDSRLSRLQSDLQANRPQNESEPGEKGGLPRLLIQQLNVLQGGFHFKDHVPEAPVDLEGGPVNISMQELNTLPDRFGQQTVTISFPGDSTLEWQGSIDLSPLQSTGSLSIRNTQLDQATAYLKAFMPLDSMAAKLAISTDYRLNSLAEGGIDVELDDLQIGLTDVSVSGLSPTTELLSLPRLALSGGQLRYPEKTLTFQLASVEEPSVTTWLDENRQFSLLQLVPEKPESNSDRTDTTSTTSSWQFEIDQLVMDNGLAKFSDQSIAPPTAVSLSGIQITADGISNESGRSIPLKVSGQLDQGGRFEFEGETAVLPAFTISGQAGVDQVPLELVQPYAQQRSALLIEGGLLSSQIELEVSPQKAISLGGSLGVADLTVSDTRTSEKLLGWSELHVDRFEWAVDQKNIQLSLLSFEQLYGRFRVNKDRSTNLSGLIQQADDSPAGEKDNEVALVVGGIRVNDGVLDFSDFSLPLQFATHISDMDGSISTIDTASTEPANIRLEGQVDEFGLARIEGTMNVFDPIGHTDVSVEFRNLLMSNLSPYTAQFAGRKIDQGKLDLDLGYVIEKGQLQAQNKVVLSDLVLGAEVDNPDAVSLPLDLAVALLKDSDGVINIDLPVTGDLNNPEFEISGVVVHAIVGLITRIVSAPFRLLGSLIGIDSEDLGRFQFLAGRSDLTPPELEKIGQLQQALQKRPKLGVEISGPFSPAVDTPKLQYYRLRDEVLSRMGQELNDEEKEIEMLDDEIRSVLEVLFTERFPGTTLESLKAAHTAESSGLDELSYSGDLRDRLLASENITTADLEALGSERAEAIRQAFLAAGEFGEKRVVVTAPTEVESEDLEWVATELAVASD